jgi:hypothetical protein
VAKAFLSSDGLSADAYLARFEGKVRNPYHKDDSIKDKMSYKTYVTQTNHDQGKKTKGDNLFDKISGVAGLGGQGGKVYIDLNNRLNWGRGSLYVLGGKSAILRMFQEGVTDPEMIVETPLRIGVYKWRNVLTASVYGVRISCGASRATAESKFVDTDVTKLLNLSGKEITIYPAILADLIKNIFDGKTG